jgi:hypothetical protein
MPDIVRKLLNLFTLVPRLPTSLVVSRALSHPQFLNLPLNETQTEDAFMSVSLVGLPREMFRSTVYMTLEVPAGTAILALLTRSNFQQELLLPPGTRYLLHRRWLEGGIVKYRGTIIP